MSYAVTLETLPQFMVDLATMVKNKKTVIVDMIEEDKLYINSEEYLSWKQNKTYNMSNPTENESFFNDLKAWK